MIFKVDLINAIRSFSFILGGILFIMASFIAIYGESPTLQTFPSIGGLANIYYYFAGVDINKDITGKRKKKRPKMTSLNEKRESNFKIYLISAFIILFFTALI